jgi:FtsZ-binding cell division protein ZapB
VRKSPNIIADLINNLAKARKVDDGRKEMHMSITEFHHSETEKSRINVKMDEIQLVQMQLNAMKERFQNCTDSEKKPKYEQSINELDNKLDNLLRP